MKKIFLAFVCLAFFASENRAQYYNNYSNYGRNSNYRGGSWLDDMSYDAPDLYRSYRAGSSLAGFGMGLTLGGLAVAVIGVATAETEETTSNGATQITFTGPGGAMLAAGVVTAIVGTPIWIVGSTKKRNAKRAYLRDYGEIRPLPVPPSPHLQLNSTANGMGLALVF
jgi:hypothetical protein